MSFIGMGPLEILVILLVAFIVLGPERAVDAGRMLGKAAKEVRRLTDELPRLTIDDLAAMPQERPSVPHRRTDVAAGEETQIDPETAGAQSGPDQDGGPVSFEPSGKDGSEGESKHRGKE